MTDGLASVAVASPLAHMRNSAAMTLTSDQESPALHGTYKIGM